MGILETVLLTLSCTLLGIVATVIIYNSNINKTLGENSKGIKILEGSFKDIKYTIGVMRSAINRLTIGLFKKGILTELFIVGESPLKLTEQGIKLLDNCGFNNIYGNNDNKEKLIQLIKKENPQSKYDVQEISKKVLILLKDDPMFIEIKKYAFNNGLDIVEILSVASIVVRDEVISQLNSLRDLV
ncbi:hypothetical protein ES702_05977 [subsurface metagenome]